MSDPIYFHGIAAEDLSAKKGYAVIADASNSDKIALADAANDDTGNELLGILTNSPAAGEEAIVCIFGLCEAKAGAAIAPGQLVTTDGSTGKLEPAATGEHAIARYVPQLKSTAGALAAGPDAADTYDIQVFVNLVYTI